MPKIYHVKKAQQRYETRPVIDPATGEPKYTVMMRNGAPMLTRRGKERRMPVTERDLTRPLPMPVCDHCRQEIQVGTPYKHITPHGSRTRSRHEYCPNWHVWEYSSSLSARIAQILYEGDREIGAAALEDLSTVRDDLAEQIRALAEEKEEAASNIEDGFGHSTYQSEELTEQAEQLNEWADEVESVDLPEGAEECEACGGVGTDEIDCDNCLGTGQADGERCTDCDGTGKNEESCSECGGTGEVEPEEDALEDARQALRDALESCPL
jgi:hypothetical protein